MKNVKEEGRRERKEEREEGGREGRIERRPAVAPMERGGGGEGRRRRREDIQSLRESRSEITLWRGGRFVGCREVSIKPVEGFTV